MSEITESAKNEDCTIRLPGICNHNPETTVFCHADKLRFGKGMGLKAKIGNLDIGAYGCFNCHMVLHGINTHLDKKDIYIAFLEGIIETIIKLYKKGLVRI